MAASYVLGLQSANVASSKKEKVLFLMNNELKYFSTYSNKAFRWKRPGT
jgi:hypothetical protein